MNNRPITSATPAIPGLGNSQRSVRVVAPTRLHFGLIGFGESKFPFGGAGLMLSSPAAIVTVTKCNDLKFSGAAAARAEEFAKKWARSTGQVLKNLHLHVAHITAQHCGLGSGTQLGLAVAKALFEFHGTAATTIAQLVSSVDRAKRSSIGSIGFAEGGFIFERGHCRGETVANNYRAIAVDPTWRFLTIRPSGLQRGLFGTAEAAAFHRLPEISPDVTDRLVNLATNRMIPALESGDAGSFGEATFEFGRLSGSCFAAEQGSAFANEDVANIVSFIRQQGVPGVGQSSWGPTVYVITKEDAEANEIAEKLRREFSALRPVLEISSASESGASIERLPVPVE